MPTCGRLLRMGRREGKAHADAREPLLAWYPHAVKAEWRGPADVKRDLGTASIRRNGRVVYIRFIGTRAEYNRFQWICLTP